MKTWTRNENFLSIIQTFILETKNIGFYKFFEKRIHQFLPNYPLKFFRYVNS